MPHLTGHEGPERLIMDEKKASLLRGAYERYLEITSVQSRDFTENYLPYDLEELDSVQWRHYGATMAKDELRELINCLNHWHSSLQKWDTWNTVIASYDVMDAWDIRLEFLDGNVHHCLYQPSSMRDLFTLVATNSMHQASLASDPQYKDCLASDPPDLQKPHHLSRRKKEKFLAQQIQSTPGSTEFLDALFKLDDAEYRKQTSDYRNRTSHAIGPRMGIGITNTVIRSIVQATELQEQPDRTFRSVAITGKMSVQYAIGGTEPLSMIDALVANCEQYERAKLCYIEYRKMLAEKLARMPKAEVK